MRLKGCLFDGKTSSSRESILIIDKYGNIESDPAIITPSSYSKVTVSSRVGNTPRTITFPTGEIFETIDHEILDLVINEQGGEKNWVHILESNTNYVVCALIFMVLFISWGTIWGVPWVSTQIAYALPAEINTHIAHGTLEILDNRVFNPSHLDIERQNELTKSFNALLPDDRQQFTYKLVYRTGGFIGANAFALPDGTIIVTDELVNLAEHDDEIMSVLLHEVGHVVHRHSLRTIINHAGLTALILTITGDVNSAGALVLVLPNVLLESSYSRDLEWEADTYSLEYMQNKGMLTEHFANFMERVENYSLQINDSDDHEYIEDECSGSGNVDITDITDDVSDIDLENTDNDIVTNTQKNDQPPPDLGWLNYISSHPPSEERIARFRGETIN